MMTKHSDGDGDSLADAFPEDGEWGDAEVAGVPVRIARGFPAASRTDPASKPDERLPVGMWHRARFGG